MPQIIIGIIVIVLAIYAIGAILATVGFIATNVILFIERAFFMSRIIPPIYSWGIIGLITGVSVAAYKEAPRYGKGAWRPLVVVIPALLIFFNGVYNHKNIQWNLVRPNTSSNSAKLNEKQKVARATTPERKSNQPKPKAAAKAPVARPLVATGITLQPGETILGTKNPDASPVELIVRFPGGEEVEINQKHWTSRSIKLTHVGQNVKGRPGEIFYRGERGRYHFQKISPNAAAEAPIASQPLIAANGGLSLSISDIKIECWGNDLTDGKIGGWKSNYPHCILNDGGGDDNAIYDGELSLEGNKLYITMKNLQTKAPPTHTLSVGFFLTLRRGSFSDGGTHKIVKMGEFHGRPDSRSIQKTFDIMNSQP